MEAVTDALRMELQPWGIAVSIIEPGTITTPIWEKSISRSDEIWAIFPEHARELYSPTLEAISKTAKKLSQNGLPAAAVAKVVARAIAAKRPKARYVVGLDAKINILLAKILPERVLDNFITIYLGLPKNSVRKNYPVEKLSS